jgi:hypothetical protein
VRGLACLCEEEIALSQELAIVFTLPGNTILLHVTGKVMNVIKREGMTRAGISFTSIPPNEVPMLEKWMSDHLPALPKKINSAEARGTH